MRKIDTIEELEAERARLRMKLRETEQLIETDVQLIKEDLQPVRIAVQAINKIMTRPDNGILNDGLNIGIDFILRKIILRNSGWLTRLVIPFMAKNISGNYIANNKGDIINWFRDLFKKWKGNGHNIYDRTTADNDY